MTTTHNDKEFLSNKRSSSTVTVTEKYHSSKRWFWSGLFRYPLLMAISVLIRLIYASITILPSILIGLGIDYLIDIGYGREFITVVWLIIGAAILSWIVSFLSSYLWVIASYRFERDIRQEFFDTVQEHSMAFLDKYNSANLLSYGMNETGQIRFAYEPAIRSLLDQILKILITCSYFFFSIKIGTEVIGIGNWQIGLAISLGFVLYMILAWQYAVKIEPVRRQLSIEQANVTSATQEVFRGIEVVRSFDNEEKEIEKFKGKSLRLADNTKQEGYISAFYWPALLVIAFLVVGFGVGLWEVYQGTMSYGQLTAMLTLLLTILAQNFMIARDMLQVKAGLINAQRIWEVMGFQDPLVEPEESKEVDWSKDIVFDNVSFNYPGTEKEVLQDISFKIPAGYRVALIGGPGSGKSTILKLLLRLYDPTEGSISLNSNNFRDITTNEIRKDVVLVEQDIFLFGDTIWNNIAFANPEATDEEVKLAAKRAQISSYIENTPEGYNTKIGEFGVTLSGGQKQRIAIARALLAKPKLLLLDDSTSALDIITEAKLRAAIEELLQNRTSITVTQRLSSLVKADMIIFLDRGRIVAIGKHENLLERCSEYQFMLSHLPRGSELLQSGRKKNPDNRGDN